LLAPWIAPEALLFPAIIYQVPDHRQHINGVSWWSIVIYTPTVFKEADQP
jgi:hypothetical protein